MGWGGGGGERLRHCYEDSAKERKEGGDNRSYAVGGKQDWKVEKKQEVKVVAREGVGGAEGLFKMTRLKGGSPRLLRR